VGEARKRALGIGLSHLELPDELESLAREVEARIPFNRVLGVHLEELTKESTRITFEMRQDLVGNFARGTLHGGVISSVLDVTGGMAALVAGADDPGSGLKERFRVLGTIDLRVDYLRPGAGQRFEATGTILRSGRKVAVARMELRNDASNLIAVGTGTYLVG
jgi:uncharacterized protein (TIGR00369 family)